MRFLGIDFGEKRIGVAISDAGGRVATPLTTLRRSSDRQIIREIVRLIEQEEIGAIVVGDPRGRGGSVGDAALRARSFARKLEAKTGLRVRLIDETLTSREASQRLPRRPRDRSRLDALAAQIILQQALDSRTEEE